MGWPGGGGGVGVLWKGVLAIGGGTAIAMAIVPSVH